MARKVKPKKPQLTCEIYVTRSWVYSVTVTSGGRDAMREAEKRVPYLAGDYGASNGERGNYRWTRKEIATSINIADRQ